MSFFDSLFKPAPFPPQSREKVTRLVDELITIGIKEDFLAEHPGNGFNAQCRHLRARAIGLDLFNVGGLDLMLWAYQKVKRKAGKVLASHLEYAWTDVGSWQA